MNFTRRHLILAATAALALAGTPALAASVPEQIVAQLQDMGFRTFDVSKTWLGRVRIVAESTKYRREIIVDPRTGEILRDLWTKLDGSPVAAQISTSGRNVDDDDHSGPGGGDDGGHSGPGGGGEEEDDDEEDDDGEEDEDESEDNSGSGGENSGSGSGSSGDSGDDDEDDDD